MKTVLIPRNCPVCDRHVDRLLYKDTHYDKQGISVVYCDGCDTAFTNPYPGSEWIKDYYKRTYDSFMPDDPELQSQLTQSSMETMVAEISELSKRPGRLLDVGCGGGSFLRIAKAKKWACFGIELSSSACKQLSERFGITVCNDTLENAPWPDCYFDAVTLWEVLEHLVDPTQQLILLNRKLKPNGILGLSTPNVGYYRTKIRFLGEKYSASSTPLWPCPYEHLQYFSLKSLRRILEQTGFQIVLARASDHILSCHTKSRPTRQYAVHAYVMMEKIVRSVTANRVSLNQGWTIYAKKVKHL